MAADGEKWQGWWFQGKGERFEARGEMCGRVTGVVENITGTDEAQPDRQTPSSNVL